jgi:hypothetical protein
MSSRPFGTVFQYRHQEPDLPTLLRAVATSVEGLGEDAHVLDVTIRPDDISADVYFSREP